MSEYWTVGEFARRASVTVRTIQYYDQQKLLKPSAKGPQNRRLYSREDERELQRILVLKFLGNSLSDIRSALAGGFDGPEVAELIDRQAELLGRDLDRLLRRMATLRELRDQVVSGDDPDWGEIAGAIDQGGAYASSMRHSVHEPEGSRAKEGEPGAPEGLPHVKRNGDRSDVTRWHEVIAEALGLMAAGVAPGDPWAQEVAARYRALCAAHGARRPSEFIPLGDAAREEDGGSVPLDELGRSVDEYLDAVYAGDAPWSSAVSS